ncbi:hypothetical protein JHK87_043413 [Glycine soja]|nr:hypothetical protein JHK87_043413 [Glycine soja]
MTSYFIATLPHIYASIFLVSFVRSLSIASPIHFVAAISTQNSILPYPISNYLIQLHTYIPKGRARAREKEAEKDVSSPLKTVEEEKAAEVIDPLGELVKNLFDIYQRPVEVSWDDVIPLYPPSQSWSISNIQNNTKDDDTWTTHCIEHLTRDFESHC